MKGYHIWHNTRVKADEYWFVREKDCRVLFYIPKWIGRLFDKYCVHGG